ncbi:MAG: biotin/lipoyl-containing protein, partial [Bacteroidota bacterium]
MLKIKVNEHKEIEIDINKNGLSLDGKIVETDIVKIGVDKYHVLFNDGSFTIELLEKSETGKELSIAINGKRQTVSVKDDFDELLHKLGMDNLNHKKMNEVKAPMPGLVLRVMVKEGDTIKTGDALLVLEAMKMENIIKATGEGVVKKIVAQIKQAVEKNQVL